eukprot:m.166231 g.166231  ORF g.166231 m.166231 type:complete len:1362 (+) comp15274_c0_seq1:118-4203(+)
MSNTQSRWPQIVRKVRTVGRVQRTLNHRLKRVSVSFINISNGSLGVKKALQSAVKLLGEDDPVLADGITLLSESDIERDDTSTIDHLCTDDLVIIDDGKEWLEHSEMSLRVGDRHSCMVKEKVTLRFWEAGHGKKAAMSETRDCKLIPYQKLEHKGKRILMALLPEENVPVHEYILKILLELAAKKKARSNMRFDQDCLILQHFDKIMTNIKKRPVPDNQQALLHEAADFILKRPNVLLTKENVGSLLRCLRDAEMFGTMLEFLNNVSNINPSLRNQENAYYDGMCHFFQGKFLICNTNDEKDIVKGIEMLNSALSICESCGKTIKDTNKMALLLAEIYFVLFLQTCKHCKFVDGSKSAVQLDRALELCKKVRDNRGESDWATSVNMICNIIVLCYLAPDMKEANKKIFESWNEICNLVARKDKCSFDPDSNFKLACARLLAGLVVHSLTHTNSNKVINQTLNAFREVCTSQAKQGKLNEVLVQLELIRQREDMDRGMTPQDPLQSAHRRHLLFWEEMLQDATRPEANSQRIPVLRCTPDQTEAMYYLSFEQEIATALQRRTSFVPGKSKKQRLSSVSSSWAIQLNPVDKDDFVKFSVESIDWLLDIKMYEKNHVDLNDRHLNILINSGSNESVNNSKTFHILFASSHRREWFRKKCVEYGYEETIMKENRSVYDLLPSDLMFLQDYDGDLTCIGEGTFANVYLGALKSSPDVRVAVKSLKSKYILEPQIVDSFEDEIRLLKSFSCENIVSFIGACEDKEANKKMLILEYIVGGSLQELLDCYGALYNPKFETESCFAIAFYVRQVVNALAYLHKMRYIHRDIKPANIMVCRNSGTVKVTDFGTLKDQVGLQKSCRELVGTIAYADRQIILGQPYGPEVDVFSLGTTVWQLVHGLHPFHDLGDNANRVLEIRKTRAQDVLEINKTCPTVIRDFITACIEPPERRPSVSELFSMHFLSKFSAEQECHDFKTNSPGNTTDDDDDLEESTRTADTCAHNTMALVLRDNLESVLQLWARQMDDSELLKSLIQEWKDSTGKAIIPTCVLQKVARQHPCSVADVIACGWPPLRQSGAEGVARLFQEHKGPSELHVRLLRKVVLIIADCLEEPDWESAKSKMDKHSKEMIDVDNNDDNHFDSLKWLYNAVGMLIDGSLNNQETDEFNPTSSFWGSFLRNSTKMAAAPHWVWSALEGTHDLLAEFQSRTVPVMRGSTLLTGHSTWNSGPSPNEAIEFPSDQPSQAIPHELLSQLAQINQAITKLASGTPPKDDRHLEQPRNHFDKGPLHARFEGLLDTKGVCSIVERLEESNISAARLANISNKKLYEMMVQGILAGISADDRISENQPVSMNSTDSDDFFCNGWMHLS